MEGWFRDSRLDELYNYWQTKLDGRAAPLRTDIDLAEIAHLLPILKLIDVGWEPLSFRHRMIGTEVVDAMGRDATGRYVDRDLYGNATDEIFASLEAVARECRPYRRLARLDWHERDWLLMEAVDLPLLGPDGITAAILGGASFRRRDMELPEQLIQEPLTIEGRGKGKAPESDG